MRSVLLSMLAKFRGLSSKRRTMLGLVALCTGGLLVSWVAGPAGRPGARAVTVGPSAVGFPVDSHVDAELKAQWQRMKEFPKVMTPDVAPSARGNLGVVGDAPEYGTPTIAHAAELAVATKEFAHSRNTLEE